MDGLTERSIFWCPRCSKELRLQFICDPPVCSRCMGICRIEALVKRPKRPELDETATAALARAMAGGFVGRLRKKETINENQH